jgi:hypothetical protein
MLFLRPCERTHQAGEPFDPFLVADESCPVNVLVFSETELEVFSGGFEISIELETRQLQHQAYFTAFFQSLAECIEKLLVFRAAYLAA